MKKNSRILQKISSLLLFVVMLLGIFAVVPAAVATGTETSAAPIVQTPTNTTIITKTEKSYDIAVVFDNSGSMYDNQGWCRAKYAMEIFASMLNYDKDKLHIFPMWEVTYDETQPSTGGSYAPIEIKDKNGINRISNLYTVNPSSTPFAPITEAYDYLKKSSADEKWLIVLTDGEFNQDARGTAASIDLQGRLESLASETIKVQYLGFGGATPLVADEGNCFYTKKSTDTSLKDDLIEICNAIFQRSVLPKNRLNGAELNLDLSMKNLIVFAQGANANIVSLTGADGKEIPITLNSGQRKYSEIRAYEYEAAPVDTTLAGQVVTFAACPKGAYTLNYSGTDAIQIFYEPDVGIDVSLLNSDGQLVTGPENFIAGEYTVSSRIVDATTGEDVTNHELMGKDVKLVTKVKSSQDTAHKNFDNGSKIYFEPEEEYEIYITGTYLGKYSIDSRNYPHLSWLYSGFKVEKPPVALTLSISGGQSWYVIKDYDEWQSYRVDMTLDGLPLTEEDFEKLKYNVELSDGLTYRCEPIEGESAFNIYLSQDENGAFIEPGTGKYNMKVSAEYDERSPATDSESFEIQKYSQIWRWLLWVVIAAVLLLLWLSFMLQKVLPKSIVKDNANFMGAIAGPLDGGFVNVEYRRKGKSLTISGPATVDYSEQCSAAFSLKAIDNRFTRSRRRRVAVTGIDSISDEVIISGTRYVKHNGQWMKSTDVNKAENGQPVSPIYQELSCSTRYEIARSGGVTTLTCKTNTIR